MEQILEMYEEEWEMLLPKKKFAPVNIEDTHVCYDVW
jgi:hypothetical protein